MNSGTTWRERIQAAKERGAFTQEDRERAMSAGTCAVGEVTERIGIDREVYIEIKLSSDASERVGISHSAGFTSKVLNGKPQEAEHILDAIEDRAILVKREASA